MTTQPVTQLPTAQTDPADIEPTEAEIARVAADEAAADRRDEKQATTPRRGPGRPPGARNRAKPQSDAKARGATSKATVKPPTTPPANPDDAARRDREERQRIREARNANIKALTDEAMKHRPGFVKGVGVATGLPPQFLVGLAVTESGEQVKDADGRPVEALTGYGEQLAPAEWQIKMAVSAYVRAEETPQGQAMMARLDKYMPYFLIAGAVGAVGIYAFTVLQTSQAIKPMIAAEIQQMQQQQAQQQQAGPQAPGAPSSGGAPG